MRVSLAGAALRSACAPAAPQLVLQGGYRAPADPCRIAAATAVAERLVESGADLVACPAEMENLGVFPTETGGVEVARMQGYVLYAVARGPA